MREPFEVLKGCTLVGIIGLQENSKLIEFHVDDGRVFELLHHQDCCEDVSVVDVTGDAADLIGSPLLLAEVATNSDDLPPPDSYAESWTWTFYKLATVKGDVAIRWLGMSNGYYGEGVDFQLRAAS